MRRNCQELLRQLLEESEPELPPRIKGEVQKEADGSSRTVPMISHYGQPSLNHHLLLLFFCGLKLGYISPQTG